MTAPTLAASAITSPWATSAATITTPSFSVVAGDLIVITSTGYDSGNTWSIANSGAALTWTQRILLRDGSAGPSSLSWTAVADSTRSLTVSVTQTLTSDPYWIAIMATVWRNAKYHAAVSNWVNGAPSINIVTTAADCAVTMINHDWNKVDGASRSYRTSGNGTFTELAYDYNAARYTHYAGYYANVGAAGTHAVGVLTPTAQFSSLGALAIEYEAPAVGGGGEYTPFTVAGTIA